MRLLLAAALIAFAAPAFAQSAIPETEIIEGAITNYIQPNFEQFAGEAGSLKTNVEALCAAPSAGSLEAARNQFRSTVVAFSRVEFVRIGPLGLFDRLERLLFWPDRKGIALRQVQTALAEQDPTAASPDTLRDKSVAMQGLGALEFLLFGTGSDELAAAAGYRCDYAASIVALVDGLATTINTEWHDDSPDGPAAHMLSPQPTFDDYRTQREVLERLAATLIHATEAIRDTRIAPILAVTTNSPKPRSALFWRSNMTVPSLAANFAGIHEFFLAARYPEAIGQVNDWVATGAIFEFENAARAAAAITDPMEQAVTDKMQLDALKYMVIITGSLDHLLGENLAAALGLSVGFSALDGD
jgi:predicted lipoprotein